MSGKRVTIRDVAAAAGVSKSLVSFVYADPNRVSKEKRELVLATAAELGFRPNWAARSLAASDGGFIGVLMADLHSPAFAEIVDGARARLKAGGRVPLMTSTHLVETDNVTALDPSAVTFFGDLRPQGLLIVGGVPDMSAVHTLAETVPTVVAGASLDAMPSVATVRTDDMAGMVSAVRHLKELGHSAITHIGGAGGRISELRAQAYADAMRAHGLEAGTRVERADFSEASGYAATLRLLDTGAEFTAISAVSDYAAVGALAALAQRDRPEVSVIGYGDTAVASFEYISLTSLRPGNTAIGERAAQELLDADGSGGSDGWVVLLPPELISRRTTRPPKHNST